MELLPQRPAQGSQDDNPRCARTLCVVERPLGDLKLDLKNPRSHSAKQVRQVADSIATFGFIVLVLVDGSGAVIAGHGRLMAARQLGMSSVPTICIEHLTPAQMRAFQIADNKLTENSEWDESLLASALKDLSIEDFDFSLEVIGFELPEIDLHIQSLESTPAAEDDQADLVPQVENIAVARPGQIWQLGQHRVICGNALDEAAYKCLLDNQLADFIFTDPPYNVPIDGHVCGSGAIKHREFAMGSGEMSRAQFTRFLQDVFDQLVTHSKKGSVHDVCMDWRHLTEILTAGEAAYAEILNLCVWAKHNGGMGSLYRSQHELILVFKNGQGSHCNNVQLGKFGRNRSNIWNYPGVNNFGRGTEEGNLLAMHPTVKPVAMIADAILDCSNRGSVVLDPFLGSGSTLIACERTGRRCHGIEIDPRYVDTALRRWQKYTGSQAVNAATGLTFIEHEKEAGNG